MGSTAMADTPVWDSMTGYANTTWGVPANGGTPTGTGNQQMGGAITLSDPAALEITGFDMTFLNSTGATLTIDATHRIRFNYWVWNTATPTGAAGTLAFSGLAGSGQIAFGNATPVTLANNTFIQFQAVAPTAGLGTAGTAPGIAITPHITVTNPGPIGIAFNWEIETVPGTFSQVAGSTMIIVSGGGAPALGTNNLEVIVGAGNGGYYRSVNRAGLDTNGNFNTSSARFVAANSSVAYRVYAAGTAVNSCCNLTTGVCSGTASSTCPSGSTFMANVTCTPNPCPLPNACCNDATGACTALLSGSCPAGSTQQSGLSCTPSPCGLVLNDDCSGAVTLNLASGAVVVGTNVGALNDAVGGCGFENVDGPSVWFQFTGTGTDVAISTCDAATSLDTIIHVVCSENGCSGPFNCVGGNDDAATACTFNPGASGLTVPTIAGNQYYVIVNGFQGATGNFGISALDTGVASTVTTTCAARARCVVDNDPFDFAETDACGAGTGLDTNNGCNTATIYPALGQIAKGTVSTTVNFRDIDIYKLPAAAAGQSVTIEINAESPVLIQSLNDVSGCVNAFTVIPNSTFNIAACVGIGNILINVTMPATGDNYFLITTPSFDGNPCGSGANSNNDYRLRLAVATLGACCIPATACASLTFADCGAAGGDFWFDGLACSLGSGNIDPCTVTVGRCCASNGTCTFVPSAAFPQGTDCTAAGGVFTADANATCTPNPCAGSTGGVCCRGSTCSTTVTSAAACTASLVPGQLAGAAFVSTATACGAGAISSTPCCLADYNKAGGISVQDIFDFLADWFAGSAYANTGGNGAAGPLAVQNIFDFLTNWFNGGCN